MSNWTNALTGRTRLRVPGVRSIPGGAVGVLAALLLLGVAGCSVASEPVSLSGLLYNYDERGIASIRVNGRGVSGWAHGAEPGAVKGGGQTCCFSLEAGARSAAIEIKYLDGEEIELLAEIEQPWPPLTSLGIVHVLPGRDLPRVVIEITPGQSFGRRDLMMNALGRAGVSPEIDYQGPLRDGPFEYTDD